MRGKLFKILFFIYLTGLCFCCFWNFRGSIGLDNDLWGIRMDKVVHFLLFFPLPIVSYMAFPQLRNTSGRYLKFSILSVAAGVLLGAVIELIQGWSGYRSCGMADLLADFCGLVSAALLLQVYEAFIGRKRIKTA